MLARPGFEKIALMSNWRKFRELRWSERGFLAVAIGGLLAVGAALALLGFERSLAWLRRSSRPRQRRRAEPEDIDRLRRQAHLIAIAARYGPYRATCLRRSLLLWWVARRRGFDPQLRIGVRRQSRTMTAHAWIELEGELLNDRAEVVANYAAFDADGLPERVSWS